MKILTTCITLSIFPALAIADQSAIEKINYNTSMLASTSDSGNKASISGELRFPVMNHTGASIKAELAKFNAKKTTQTVPTGRLALVFL